MCHGHRGHHRGHRFGSRRFPNREQWLEHLEQYQRDLEQEAADVADVIKRLREEQAPEPVTV